MYILIVTGSGLRKVNKLMLVPPANVVRLGCTPCTCNITWEIISAWHYSTKFKGNWLSDLTLSVIILSQVHVCVLARKKVGFKLHLKWSMLFIMLFYGFCTVSLTQTARLNFHTFEMFFFLPHEKSMHPYFFCTTPCWGRRS